MGPNFETRFNLATSRPFHLFHTSAISQCVRHYHKAAATREPASDEAETAVVVAAWLLMKHDALALGTRGAE